MDQYLGISYLKDGDPEWTEEQLQQWKEKECSKGNHLWDEVVSTNSHYLFCDACGATKAL